MTNAPQMVVLPTDAPYVGVQAVRQGWWVTFAFREHDRLVPFPQPLADKLLPALAYYHREFLRGTAQIMSDGTRRKMQLTTYRLYDRWPDYPEPIERIRTSMGMLHRVGAICREMGYGARLWDHSLAPKRHPQAYTPDWAWLEDQMRRLGYEFRPRQRECLEALVRPGVYGGICNAPPAFGKSLVVAMLTTLLRQAKIAIVTKRTDVVGTLYDRLCEWQPSVGLVRGGISPKRREGRVVVATADSMHKLDPDFDLVIGDEIHELGSDKLSGVFVRTFANARHYGFSATPYGRADTGSARIEYMFGPELFSMSWAEATQLGLIVPAEVRWLDLRLKRNPIAGIKVDAYKLRAGIWRNRERNQAIAAAVRRHPDEQVLILVSTTEHALRLRKLLPDFEVVYDSVDDARWLGFQSADLLRPEEVRMNGTKRAQMRKQFESGQLRRVIATDVWSTGVSFEQLAVLVIADARISAIVGDQGPGRVVRTHAASGKQRGIIYDCWDFWDPDFEKRSKTRDARYRKKGWVRLHELGEFE